MLQMYKGISTFYWPNDTTCHVATKDKIITELKSLLSFTYFPAFKFSHGENIYNKLTLVLIYN